METQKKYITQYSFAIECKTNPQAVHGAVKAGNVRAVMVCGHPMVDTADPLNIAWKELQLARAKHKEVK